MLNIIDDLDILEKFKDNGELSLNDISKYFKEASFKQPYPSGYGCLIL